MPTAREVKEIFVLGNSLKGDWNDMSVFKASLDAEKARIAEMSDMTLNNHITDMKRLGGYDNARLWTLEQVPLDTCAIWPGMEKRNYMKGTVNEAASQFEQQGSTTDRLHSMSKMAKLGLYQELPIILYRRKKNPGYRIDDGCHRAVATYLAGKRIINAYIGTVPDMYNHSW